MRTVADINASAQQARGVDGQGGPAGLPEALGGSVLELAPYMVVEPFVMDRDVVDVDPAHERGIDRLAVVGRARVRRARWTGTAIDAADGSADVLLCLRGLVLAGDDFTEPDKLMTEILRVLRPDGFCVVRVAGATGHATGPSRAGTEAPQLPTRAGLERWLRGWFVSVDVVGQIPFFGFSFAVPGVAEVAVNEDLLPPEGSPMYHLAFCSRTAQRGYDLSESLIVPVTYPDGVPPSRAEWLAITSRIEELTRERDAIREQLMTGEDQRERLEDQRERLERTAVALRRDAERLLQQVSEQAEALEVAGLELDAAQRRAAAGERRATAAELALAVPSATQLDEEPIIVDEMPLDPG